MPIKRPETPLGFHHPRQQDVVPPSHPPRVSSLSWQDRSRPRYLPAPTVIDFGQDPGGSASDHDSPELAPAIPVRSPNRVRSNPFDRLPKTPGARLSDSANQDSPQLVKGKGLASPFETPAPPTRPPPATPGKSKHTRKRSRSSRSSTTTTNTSTSRSSRGSKRSRSELSVFPPIAHTRRNGSDAPALPSKASTRTVSLERPQPSKFQQQRMIVNRSRMPRCSSRYWDETDYLRSLLPDVDEAAEPPSIPQGEGCPHIQCSVCSHNGRHKHRRDTRTSKASMGLNSSPEHLRSPATEREYIKWSKSKKRRKKDDQAKPDAIVPEPTGLLTPPPEPEPELQPELKSDQAKTPHVSVEEVGLTTHDFLSLALHGTRWSREMRKVETASQEDLAQRMREFEAAQVFKRKCLQERKSTGMAGMKKAKTAIARRMGWL